MFFEQYQHFYTQNSKTHKMLYIVNNLKRHWRKKIGSEIYIYLYTILGGGFGGKEPDNFMFIIFWREILHFYDFK